MKKSLVALLLSMGVAAFSANLALAALDESVDVQAMMKNASMAKELQSRASRLSTSSNEDTVYVGFTPGHTGDNYWSIWSGGDKHDGGPWHRPPAQNGMWGWEPPYPHGDTLQGWTPVRMPMSGTGGLTIPDFNRPWRCLDYGNMANAIIPGISRTGGVVGVWHVDGGNTVAVPASVNHPADFTNGAGGLVGGVNWAPLAGTRSAWMGLRRHGDNTHVDDVARGGTGNAYNEDLLLWNILAGSAGLGGSDHRFPGYGDQMDQMLYRDVDVAGVSSLVVGFTYRTRLATGITTNNITRSGWFQWDPLTVSTGGSNPNFIGSTGVAAPPADSFLVYVGAPAEGSVTLTTGLKPIYDKKRRWAGEVIRGVEGLYKQVASIGGTNATTSTTVTVDGAQLTAIKAAATVDGGVINKARIVFRVKTNQAFSDQSQNIAGASSDGAGAVIVDAVTVQKDGGAITTIGAFEATTDINNSTDYGSYSNTGHANHPLNKWKSTGKPTKIYAHTHPLSGDVGSPPGGRDAYAALLYEDLCGSHDPPNPARICDMVGVVITASDHDNNESSGGVFTTAEQEPFDGFYSPTVNLIGQGYTTRIIDGNVTPVNNMGLSALDAVATEQMYLDYEGYYGRFDFFNTANAFRFGFQSFPSTNGAAPATGEYKRWGAVRFPGFIFANSDKQCFRSLDGTVQWGMMRTSNASGVPDSVRIHIHTRQEAYRFNLTESELFDGSYWDNFSLTIVDGATVPVGVDIWHFYQDTFPFNNNDGLVGFSTAFDTTTAYMKTGLNVAPSTGDDNRFMVPGDSTVVIAGGNNVRVDLVFRVLPGPGNYTNPTAVNTAQLLKKLPNAATPVAGAVASSTNFWESYMHTKSLYAPAGAGTHPAPQWSPHVWNAARLDTSEVAFFQIQSRLTPQPARSELFQTSYHETELTNSHRRGLAVNRNICFVADTSSLVPTSTVICGSGAVPLGTVYPPAWAFAPGSGLPTAGNGDPLASPSQVISCPGPAGSGLCQSIEGTKVLPDGLFTPGTHIAYFFRREDVGPGTTYLVPDTNVVSIDGHRWQEVSVLPDRWKDGTYNHPVLNEALGAPACALYLDWNDGRGNERVFLGIADSIGMNAAAKRGGSNGQSAAGDADVNDPTYFVRRHIGQAGTYFDKYDVKASESLNGKVGGIGSRLGEANPANTQIVGKRSFQGPSETMLTTFYKVIYILTGDLNSGIWGPFLNYSSDDAGILTSFATSGDDSDPDRGFYVGGDGWNEAAFGGGADDEIFINNILHVTLASENYLKASANNAFSADVYPTAKLPQADGDIYGLRNACFFTLDVAEIASGDNSAFAASHYEDPSNTGPHISGVLKEHTPGTSPWVALVDGWDIEVLTARDEISSRGRLTYYYKAFQDAFSAIVGCQLVGSPLTTTDTPINGSGRLHNFMSLRNNPLRSGSATFTIGLAKGDRVKVQIFDVAGRLVRNLTDRNFAAGEHILTWDGVDNSGRQVARGVYFAKLQYAAQGYVANDKLVVLK